MPRTTLNIPQDMLDAIDAQMEEDFSNRSSALMKLWRQIWSQSTSPCISAHQPASSDAPSTSPSPARARVDDVGDRQTDKESFLAENTPEAVVKAIEECEWAKMRFPLGASPLAYIAKLMRRYPKMTPAHVYDAALWVTNNPPKVANRKYLGGFLTNWMRNDGKFAAATKSQQSLPATSAQRGLGDDEGYENGTW